MTLYHNNRFKNVFTSNNGGQNKLKYMYFNTWYKFLTTLHFISIFYKNKCVYLIRILLPSKSINITNKS